MEERKMTTFKEMKVMMKIDGGDGDDVITDGEDGNGTYTSRK